MLQNALTTAANSVKFSDASGHCDDLFTDPSVLLRDDPLEPPSTAPAQSDVESLSTNMNMSPAVIDTFDEVRLCVICVPGRDRLFCSLRTHTRISSTRSHALAAH